MRNLGDSLRCQPAPGQLRQSREWRCQCGNLVAAVCAAYRAQHSCFRLHGSSVSQQAAHMLLLQLQSFSGRHFCHAPRSFSDPSPGSERAVQQGAGSQPTEPLPTVDGELLRQVGVPFQHPSNVGYGLLCFSGRRGAALAVKFDEEGIHLDHSSSYSHALNPKPLREILAVAI
ncbi:unnamed protein product [Symbiodinium sp. CCMP2592]|nr:unnamed protein product [Symbiodinium sp. CCMP2592]